MVQTMRRIFWASDSTVQTNKIFTYPQTGIGQELYRYLKDDVLVVNRARNGRSTKSFMTEGRLERIEEEIENGDFLFIQFGHNDEKKDDPARYTEPFSSFIENLEIYICVARVHGAYPVLITPLERRCFVDEEHLGKGDHSDYVEAIKQTAKKDDVALIDLYGMSRAAMEKAGKSGSRQWYMNFDKGIYDNYPDGKDDNTHLRYEGAVMYAGLVAKGLEELGGIYKDLLTSKEEEEAK